MAISFGRFRTADEKLWQNRGSFFLILCTEFIKDRHAVQETGTRGANPRVPRVHTSGIGEKLSAADTHLRLHDKEHALELVQLQANKSYIYEKHRPSKSKHLSQPCLTLAPPRSVWP